jgi:hypothetical protein
MKSLTRKSLGLAIVTALAAVGLFAFASPAGAYAPAPPPPNKLAPPPCQGSTTLTGDPLGAFDAPTYFEFYQSNTAIVHGWAIDPQAGSGPIDVRIDLTVYKRTPDGFVWTYPASVTTTANYGSSDPALTCWGLGSQHAFYIRWGEPPYPEEGLTQHHIFRVDACVTAINVGWGRDTSLGCKTVWQGFASN